MTIETLKSPNPRNQNSISVIKSKFLSVSSMNTLLAILKVTDTRRDVILAGRLYHRFPWRHLPPAPAFSKKKLPHNFLDSSPLLEMPTWPFRPCASVGAEGSFNSVRQIGLAIGLKMKKRLTNSQSRFELREEY